jgi:hypothetical protein
MLFAAYDPLFWINGLPSIAKENPKVSVRRVVDALKPKPLQARVKDDMEFARTHLEKDFLKFMDHVVKRAEIYSDFEEPVPFASSKGGVQFSATASRSAENVMGRSVDKTRRIRHSDLMSDSSAQKTAPKKAPDCLNPECKEKHYLRECKITSQERKDEVHLQRSQAQKASSEQRTTRADARTGVSGSAAGLTTSGATSRSDHSAKAVRSCAINS